MTEYDPKALRDSAALLARRAGTTPFVYAAVAFVVGALLGASMVVAANALRRLNQLRTHEDAAEVLHSEDKAAEVASLFDRAGAGMLGVGIVLGALGGLAGSRKAQKMRLLAQQALCLVEIEKKLRVEAREGG
jgi:hypothetical protein